MFAAAGALGKGSQCVRRPSASGAARPGPVLPNCPSSRSELQQSLSDIGTTRLCPAPPRRLRLGPAADARHTHMVVLQGRAQPAC